MTATSIKERFAELGTNIPLEDITSRIDDLTGRFRVPVDESERSVINYFLREHAINRADYYKGMGAKPAVTIADIPQSDGKWVNIRAKCAQLWEATSPSMSQVGLLGDETGRTKFVSWMSADLPRIEEGKSYLFENIVTNEWQGKISVSFNKTSKITEIDDDIKVGDTTSEYTGALVSIKNGSGLIRRCPTCNRALRSGVCSEHGSVDGKYDLRILGVLDDGTSTQDILLGLDETVALWGTSLEDAKTSAVDALDAGIVLDQMRTSLLGRYYTVSGSDMGDMLLVKSCEVI